MRKPTFLGKMFKKKAKPPVESPQEKLLNFEKAKAAVQKAKPAKPVESATMVEQKQMLAMAGKAADYTPFIKACKQAGYNNPRKTFLGFYEQLQTSANIEVLEFDAKMNAKKAGKKKFSRTGFYVKLIIEHLRKHPGKQ